MAIPALKFLIGFKGRAGTEISLGPYVSLANPDTGMQLSFSSAYMLGWTISSKGVSVPIHFSFVPYPSYVNPRLTLTTGFSFYVAD